MLIHSVNSDWLFYTTSRVLQADWFILDINEEATLNIKMLYYMYRHDNGVSCENS